jgi:type III secretory pathway component EscR
MGSSFVEYLSYLVQPIQEKGKIYKMGKEGTYIRSWPIASTKDNFHNSKLNNNNKTKVVLLAMKCPLACLQYLKKGTEKECKQQVHKNALYFWYTQDTRWFNVDRLPSLTKFQANPHLQIKL